MAHGIMGGTLTYVHKGHAAMLAACRKFSRITIGLTSDEYVKKHKIYPSFPYGKRLRMLKKALARNGLLKKCSIGKIDSDTEIADRIVADAIVVSEETAGAAHRINKLRKKHGLPHLKIVCIPLVYGENLQKISCIDIYEGKVDLEGRLKKPLAIQAGTDNPTKLSGTSRALAVVFGKKFSLAGHKEDSRVSHHPFNNETFTGAKNRAHAAWKRAKGECGYSLGIESGLFTLGGAHIDITICCVYDGKEETYGTGMGFVVPDWIARKIRERGSDLSKVMSEFAGVEKIGRKQGALGWFSDGKMHRREQIEAAVKCAFVPRIARARKGVKY
ncbi:MAG: inosine/xanthosine triphosphatase [Candidatus Micrarchaeota archaeon]|nr:inosine/xanthosine triphosphatase [Candidatus Micrarchaeota archaeon]